MQTPGLAQTVRRIHTIRGVRVMLDSDLASLYGVTTKRLNEQLRRNRGRFPEDFAFQLNDGEAAFLKTQIAPLKRGRGQHRKYRPYAFTQHGAVQVAAILKTPEAVHMSVFVIRAFISPG